MAGIGLTTVEWSWWGPTAFAAGALWPTLSVGRDLVPPMIVMAGVALVGLALARSREARTRPVAPLGGSGMSLERQYRRLLLAYPRSYRERRGEEIVATLLDDAEPGRTRPDGRAVLDLVVGGLRERFGLHDRDGFAAGAALVGPVALAITVANAVAFPVQGLGGAAGGRHGPGVGVRARGPVGAPVVGSARRRGGGGDHGGRRRPWRIRGCSS